MSAGEESLNLAWKPPSYQMVRFSLSSSQLSLHNTAALCHALQRLNKGHCSPISQVNKSESEMRCFLYWNNGFPIGENMAGDETQ